MRRMYVAIVEVASREARLRAGAELVLADFAPQVCTSAEGWLTLQVEVAATDVAHATSVATAMARAATGADAIACYTVTLQEHEGRRSSTSELIGQKTAG